MLIKKNGISYFDLAKNLGVSEATVKRRLNGGQLTLSQLMEFSEILNISVYDLIETSRNQDTKPCQFSHAQEELLGKDLSYLQIFRLSMLKSSFSDIQKYLDLSELELRKKLKRLEKVGLVRLMPEDRIVPILTYPVKWIEGGPLQKAYFKKNISSLFEYISDNYVGSLFEKGSEKLCKPYEMFLSSEHHLQFNQELMDVYSKYVLVSRIDMRNHERQGRVISGILFSDSFSIWRPQAALAVPPLDV